MKTKIETEAKIKLTNEEFKRVKKSLDLVFVNPESKVEHERKYRGFISREIQTNIYYRNEDGEIIRGRFGPIENIYGEISKWNFGRVNWKERGGKIFLNKKLPSEEKSKFKIVIEKETELFFPYVTKENLNSIVEFFEYEEIFRYKKERINYIHPDILNTVVSLDEIKDKTEDPMHYIEIEGEEKNIEKIIQRLNLQSKPIEKRSYLEILNGRKYD